MILASNKGVFFGIKVFFSCQMASLWGIDQPSVFYKDQFHVH